MMRHHFDREKEKGGGGRYFYIPRQEEIEIGKETLSISKKGKSD